ncbi:hypothetical protein [Massilia pseudoviolaceinigra]|uniref:hypothetical protein n=1 Tax=Massilia pseudoviolaceinigra TaxID=3057165 RepID=UPI0027969152|nr:hypothetical protein [Massilia sp. CCM 9206]MDQ1924181.1 hypothetical protein [Massilia sp. CCM 9206]
MHFRDAVDIKVIQKYLTWTGAKADGLDVQPGNLPANATLKRAFFKLSDAIWLLSPDHGTGLPVNAAAGSRNDHKKDPIQ